MITAYYINNDNANGEIEMKELIETFNLNNSYISRQISLSNYLNLLKEHNVSYQGSDQATRSELAKVLARKNIKLA